MAAPHWAPPVNGFIFTGQLSLRGRVGVTAGFSSTFQEGQRCWWGLIKQPLLKRQSSVSPSSLPIRGMFDSSDSRTYLFLKAETASSTVLDLLCKHFKMPLVESFLFFFLLMPVVKSALDRVQLNSRVKKAEARLQPSTACLRCWCRIMTCQTPGDSVSLHHLWGERLLVMVCHRNNPLACSSIRQWNKLSNCGWEGVNPAEAALLKASAATAQAFWNLCQFMATSDDPFSLTLIDSGLHCALFNSSATHRPSSYNTGVP